MMAAIRNSVFGKCLRVLLIGYFLLSSLNLSSSIDRILRNQNSNVYKQSGMMCKVVKLFFDCEESVEENKLESKTTKKGLLALDYIVPGYGWPAANTSVVFLAAEAFSGVHDLKNGLHAKIHLPPPEQHR